MSRTPSSRTVPCSARLPAARDEPFTSARPAPPGSPAGCCRGWCVTATCDESSCVYVVPRPSTGWGFAAGRWPRRPALRRRHGLDRGLAVDRPVAAGRPPACAAGLDVPACGRGPAAQRHRRRRGARLPARGPGPDRRADRHHAASHRVGRRWADPRDLAMGGLDALLRHGSFTSGELLDGVERFGRQRGVVQLRALAPLADPRSESLGESVLRLRWLDLTSLPRPEPQVPVFDDWGQEVYRLDLGVEELRFSAEYDGEEFHSTRRTATTTSPVGTGSPANVAGSSRRCGGRTSSGPRGTSRRSCTAASIVRGDGSGCRGSDDLRSRRLDAVLSDLRSRRLDLRGRARSRRPPGRRTAPRPPHLVPQHRDEQPVPWRLDRLEGAVLGVRRSRETGVRRDRLVVVTPHVVAVTDQHPQPTAGRGGHIHVAERVPAG